MASSRFRALVRKESWARYFATLKYTLHVITHPFDGFWDLSREGRGSLAAANTIVALTLLTRVLLLQYSGFVFVDVHWEYVNLVEECLSILMLLLIFCLANWSLTTLFDGKGKLRDIYISTAYAITPYVLIQLPMILFSNLLTYDERVVYMVMYYVSILWCAYLIVCAMMMVQDYTVGKTLLFVVASLLGMAIILFLLLLFLSLLSNGVGYVASLYREVVFRLY